MPVGGSYWYIYIPGGLAEPASRESEAPLPTIDKRHYRQDTDETGNRRSLGPQHCAHVT